MNFLFQFADRVHDGFKSRNITIEHILHCFVIRGQCCKAILRGNQLQSAGNSFMVLCPRSRIEFHFEIHHGFQQSYPRKGSLFYRRHRHTVQVIIVPRITLRHFRTFRPVGFMMQDRCLFPESPLRRNRQNRRVLLRKYFWVIGCSVGFN